jgi:hypothetical protein
MGYTNHKLEDVKTKGGVTYRMDIVIVNKISLALNCHRPQTVAINRISALHKV